MSAAAAAGRPGPILSLMRTRSTPVALTLLALTGAALSGGCLKKTIRVTSEPDGALVWINDVEVGRTPLETEFTFYGTYDVRVRREGYEAIITHEKADSPLYAVPPLDLAAEAVPARIENLIRWHYVLTPVAEATGTKDGAEAGLVGRADELRRQAVAAPADGAGATGAAPAR